MARTTEALVKSVLRLGSQGGDYDDANNPSLTRPIAAANQFVTRAATCATNRGITLSSDELTEIETWMGAHFYTKMDRVYQSKSTNGASASFVLDPKVPEPYKAAAIEMDASGCVAALLAGNRARLSWVGKAPSEQTAYEDRD
jgi:hypothetical protein